MPRTYLPELENFRDPQMAAALNIALRRAEQRVTDLEEQYTEKFVLDEELLELLEVYRKFKSELRRMVPGLDPKDYF